MATPVGPVAPDPDDPDQWDEWYEDEEDLSGDGLSMPVRLVALVVLVAMALLIFTGLLL